MKSTWPTPGPLFGNPTPPIFHLLAIGVGIGGNANSSIGIGGNANFSVFRYQHVGIPTQNCGVEGLRQRVDPTRMVLRRSGIEALRLVYRKYCHISDSPHHRLYFSFGIKGHYIPSKVAVTWACLNE